MEPKFQIQVSKLLSFTSTKIYNTRIYNIFKIVKSFESKLKIKFLKSYKIISYRIISVFPVFGSVFEQFMSVI